MSGDEVADTLSLPSPRAPSCGIPMGSEAEALPGPDSGVEFRGLGAHGARGGDDPLPSWQVYHSEVGEDVDDEELLASFRSFASFGAGAAPSSQAAGGRAVEMDGPRFAKLCRETGLQAGRLSSVGIDIIFSQVKAKVRPPLYSLANYPPCRPTPPPAFFLVLPSLSFAKPLPLWPPRPRIFTIIPSLFFPPPPHTDFPSYYSSLPPSPPPQPTAHTSSHSSPHYRPPPFPAHFLPRLHSPPLNMLHAAPPTPIPRRYFPHLLPPLLPPWHHPPVPVLPTPPSPDPVQTYTSMAYACCEQALMRPSHAPLIGSVTGEQMRLTCRHLKTLSFRSALAVARGDRLLFLLSDSPGRLSDSRRRMQQRRLCGLRGPAAGRPWGVQGTRRIGFREFMAALPLIAQDRGISVEEVRCTAPALAPVVPPSQPPLVLPLHRPARLPAVPRANGFRRCTALQPLPKPLLPP